MNNELKKANYCEQLVEAYGKSDAKYKTIANCKELIKALHTSDLERVTKALANVELSLEILTVGLKLERSEIIKSKNIIIDKRLEKLAKEVHND